MNRSRGRPDLGAYFNQDRSAPTSLANGRYQINEFLGEGDRERVYQARDTVLARDVVLAVIKTEGLDPTSPGCSSGVIRLSSGERRIR